MSRQPLGVAEKHPYLIPTLEAPTDEIGDPDLVREYSAVRLFCERAETARPGFVVAGENTFAVAVGWHGAEKLDWRLEGPYLDEGFSLWQEYHDPLLSAMFWTRFRPKRVRRFGTLFSLVLALSTPVLPIPALTGADAPGRIPMATASALAAPAEDQVAVVDLSQGLWSLRNDAGGTFTFYFGNPGDAPFAGDWDCDGVDTPGLYRQSDGYVYLRNSNTQGIADVSFFFGNPGDIPIAGDFNADGCDTVSIYRPSQGRVFIINKLGRGDAGLGVAELDYYFGNPGDTPLTGDFNNDGTDTVGLYRESTGSMYFRNSHAQGIADFDFFFGNPGDRFVGGDWTGDGTDSPGVFRPTQATFYLKHTNTQGNADVSFAYGNANSYPVAGNWGDIPGIPDIELHFSHPTDGDTVFHTEPVTASVGGGSGARVDLAVAR